MDKLHMPFPPPIFIIETLTTNVTLFGDRASEEVKSNEVIRVGS